MGNHWRAKGHRSKAIAVPPHQAKEFTREAQKAGIDGAYCPQTGEFVANSRKARAQEAQRRGGFFDADGGYMEDKYRR
jgi:hypothetical protein